MRSLFVKIYPNFVTFNQFFKIKKKISKIREKSEKIDMYSEKLTNQFWLKKRGTGFFVEQFLFQFVNNFLELLRM